MGGAVSGARPSPPTAAPDIKETQLALGQLCLNDGPAQWPQAVEWFRSAARGGDARALTMLGRCHEMGWGVPIDTALAAAYYRKAADGGDGWALFNLADLHLEGRGVARSPEQAFTLYLAAARAGIVKAFNMLGMLHEDGRGCAVDRAAARACFEKAAHGGDCWGQFNHARMLALSGDRAGALQWFKAALDGGFSDFFRHMAAALAHTPDPDLRALAALAAHKAVPPMPAQTGTAPQDDAQ